MAYLSYENLKNMGFKSLGKNVKISDKAAIYDCEQIEIGDNSRIDDFCIISGSIKIGAYCHITPMCLLAGGTEGIILQDFVTLAYGVKVFSQSDDYSGETMTNSLIPSKYKKEFKSAVLLERFSIVGANSTVMPGVTIAEGCSIGSMSLLLKDTEAWGIYVGIPAIKLKERSKEMLKLVDCFYKEIEK
ncbi:MULTISPECIES: acyltransferase [Acinetobacter]|uniref:acyltransferase n=1 Tax=Acinetobacter TaxID=469 RepID=UPI00257D157D|nr:MULTISPECIES: acyltransferase [Acinetobacter]